MQFDQIRLTIRLTVPDNKVRHDLPHSPAKVGQALAKVIDQYSREHELGYYPALEFFRQVQEFDQTLIDKADQVAWYISKLARKEIQSLLRPIFSTLKFQSVQTEAFSMPQVRPGHADALDELTKHYTPDTVRIELMVSMLRKDDDNRGAAAEGYARKMIFRWLKGTFENVEVTASAAMD